MWAATDTPVLVGGRVKALAWNGSSQKQTTLFRVQG